MAKHRKLIRRESLWQRIISGPFDVLLSINESIKLVDWDDKAYDVAIVAGAVGNILLFISRLIVRSYASSLNSSLIDGNVVFSGSASGGTSTGSHQEGAIGSATVMSSGLSGITIQKPFFYVVFSGISLTCLILCIANVCACYFSSRKYTLIGRPIDNKPETPSGHKIKYQDPNDAPTMSPFSQLFSPFKLMAKKELDDTSKASKISSDQVWELDIWDPPLFNLILASIFSPLHIIVIWVGLGNAFVQLAFLTLLSAYLFTLTKLFLVQQKDRAIIQAEVFGEYEAKVVKPRLSVVQRDVSVGTDGVVRSSTPTRNNQFVTVNLRNLASKPSFNSQRSQSSSPLKPRFDLDSSRSSSFQSSPSPAYRLRDLNPGQGPGPAFTSPTLSTSHGSSLRKTKPWQAK